MAQDVLNSIQAQVGGQVLPCAVHKQDSLHPKPQAWACSRHSTLDGWQKASHVRGECWTSEVSVVGVCGARRCPIQAHSVQHSMVRMPKVK